MFVNYFGVYNYLKVKIFKYLIVVFFILGIIMVIIICFIIWVLFIIDIVWIRSVR